jgi:hypothetical protein
MGWKLTFALVLVTITATAAWIAGSGKEDEAALQERAARQLSALREHLLKR